MPSTNVQKLYTGHIPTNNCVIKLIMYVHFGNLSKPNYNMYVLDIFNL